VPGLAAPSFPRLGIGVLHAAGHHDLLRWDGVAPQAMERPGQARTAGAGRGCGIETVHGYGSNSCARGEFVLLTYGVRPLTRRFDQLPPIRWLLRSHLYQPGWLRRSQA